MLPEHGDMVNRLTLLLGRFSPTDILVAEKLPFEPRHLASVQLLVTKVDGGASQVRRTTSRPIAARGVGVLLDQLLLVLHRASGGVDPERLAEFGIEPLADLQDERPRRRTDVAVLLLQPFVDLDVLILRQRHQQANLDETL